MDYGIKVSQAGYEVTTATPSQLVFSSKYQTPKIHAQGSGTLTDSSRTVTIAHGLGYVPLFLVHSQIDPQFSADYSTTTNYFISPFQNSVGGGHVDRNVIAWADSTNLYIKVRPDFGKYFYDLSSSDINKCMAGEIEGVGNLTGEWFVGKSSGHKLHGAVRFGNVTIAKNESIYSATINLLIGSDRGGSGQVNAQFVGIDEDNTGDFDSGSTAMSRSATSAQVNSNTTQSVGDNWRVNVKSIVDEITTRAGWSSGNAMGIKFLDNGTSDGNYYDSLTGWGFYSSYHWLEIVRSNNLANYKYTIFKNQIQ
jgi:hypothetical protein